MTKESADALVALLRTLPDQLVSIQLDLQPLCLGEIAVPQHVRATLDDACKRLREAVANVTSVAAKIGR